MVMNTMFEQKIQIFQCNIDNLSLDETINKIESIISERKPRQHVVVNAGKIVKIYENSELKKIVTSCEIINADGVAVVWASRLLGKPLKERVSGIDLMIKLLTKACEKQYRVYFLGGEKKILEASIDKCINTYAGLNIAGYRDGYWKIEQENEVVEEIARTEPDILFVGISSPKKEIFLSKYLTKLNVPFCMGVGGSFDILSGKLSRAPLIIQKMGFEWLWRFIQEPHRLWRRYVIDNTKFIFIVAREFIKN